MASNFAAVYDANVLYPAPLRDLLMHLALTDLFRARWTDEIHDEWIRNVLKDRPDLTREQLERTRRLMNENVRDCLVTGYEWMIESLELPDPGDRHVLAAAIKCNAGVIVTMNLKDFPEEVLSRYEIEAKHPDDFVLDLIDLDQFLVARAVKRQQMSLRKPPVSVDSFLETLRCHQLTLTADRLGGLIREV